MQRLAQLNSQIVDSSNTAALGKRELRHIKMAPADPILGLSAGYKADKFPQKVNLGIGAYRDEDGKPFVFPVVRKAE